MKGSVFVLLGCFALFFAAPSRSYSISEDDQLADRRDTQSGSPSTDAATSGDAGESETVRTDANPGDVQAGKSKVRKRDTRGLFGEGMKPVEKTVPRINKSFVLNLFRKLGKYGGQCLEQAFNTIDAQEMPTGVVSWYPASLTRADMVKWLKIVKDSVSDCLAIYVGQLIMKDSVNVVDMPLPNSDKFTNVYELMLPLTRISRTLEKCVEDAIRYLEATPHGPGKTVQRSSESFSDLLTELIETLPLIAGGVAPAGDAAPMSPPDHDVLPYIDSLPLITTYKKRNSPDKSRGYRHYTTLPALHPHYIYAKNISDLAVPQYSEFRQEAVRVPSTHPEYVKPLPTQQLSLLDIVLDNIYSKLEEKVTPAVNMETAPVEGLRVDANGALGPYPGYGSSPALNPECVRKRKMLYGG